MRSNEWLDGCALQDIFRINHIAVCSARLVIVNCTAFPSSLAVQTVHFTPFELLHVSCTGIYSGMNVCRERHKVKESLSGSELKSLGSLQMEKQGEKRRWKYKGGRGRGGLLLVNCSAFDLLVPEKLFVLLHFITC